MYWAFSLLFAKTIEIVRTSLKNAKILPTSIGENAEVRFVQFWGSGLRDLEPPGGCLGGWMLSKSIRQSPPGVRLTRRKSSLATLLTEPSAENSARYWLLRTTQVSSPNNECQIPNRNPNMSTTNFHDPYLETCSLGVSPKHTQNLITADREFQPNLWKLNLNRSTSCSCRH